MRAIGVSRASDRSEPRAASGVRVSVCGGYIRLRVERMKCGDKRCRLKACVLKRCGVTMKSQVVCAMLSPIVRSPCTTYLHNVLVMLPVGWKAYVTLVRIHRILNHRVIVVQCICCVLHSLQLCVINRQYI